MRTKLILFLVALAVVLVPTEQYDWKEWVEEPYPDYTMHRVQKKEEPKQRVLLPTVQYDSKEWVEVPYPNYTMHLVKKPEQKQRALFPVVFHLFTKENAKESQILLAGDDLKESHFNPENPTRFLIPGWLENRSHTEGSPLTMIRDQYLSVGPFNIFIVDWSQGNKEDYIRSAHNTQYVGRKIAAFIEHGNLIADDTYIIGFDLGAHIAGIAGKLVVPHQINTIIGLDPARPLFTDADPSERLTEDDALYVETIHTNAGFLGLEGPIGHASFYPNYGSYQPQCALLKAPNCSHSLAYYYFAESITHPDNYIAVQCSSYSEILEQDCYSNGINLNMGGEPSNYGLSHPGVYYLKTRGFKK